MYEIKNKDCFSTVSKDIAYASIEKGSVLTCPL